MAATGAPASEPRQIPVKVTTAPMSVRPRVSNAASAAASKSALCNRMVAGIELSSRHWRKERDFLGARDRRTGLDMGVIYGCADHLGVFKRKRIFLAAPRQASQAIRSATVVTPAGGSTTSSPLPRRSRTQAKYRSFTLIPRSDAVHRRGNNHTPYRVSLWRKSIAA